VTSVCVHEVLLRWKSCSNPRPSRDEQIQSRLITAVKVGTCSRPIVIIYAITVLRNHRFSVVQRYFYVYEEHKNTKNIILSFTILKSPVLSCRTGVCVKGNVLQY
jgi:hypothetical protein